MYPDQKSRAQLTNDSQIHVLISGEEPRRGSDRALQTSPSAQLHYRRPYAQRLLRLGISLSAISLCIACSEGDMPTVESDELDQVPTVSADEATAVILPADLISPTVALREVIEQEEQVEAPEPGVDSPKGEEQEEEEEDTEADVSRINI